MSKFQPGEPATTTKGYGLECVTSSNWFVVFRCITLHGAPLPPERQDWIVLTPAGDFLDWADYEPIHWPGKMTA
jgi:hypothetical protein